MDGQYILGVRMRSTSEVEAKVLKDASPWVELQPERQRSKDPSPLKVKEVEVNGRRYVVCLNEEQRRKDVADRQAIVAALKTQLTKDGDKSLIGNKGYRKYFKAVGDKAFAVDEAEIGADAIYDGQWVLRTNMDLET